MVAGSKGHGTFWNPRSGHRNYGAETARPAELRGGPHHTVHAGQPDLSAAPPPAVRQVGPSQFPETLPSRNVACRDVLGVGKLHLDFKPPYLCVKAIFSLLFSDFRWVSAGLA